MVQWGHQGPWRCSEVHSPICLCHPLHCCLIFQAYWSRPHRAVPLNIPGTGHPVKPAAHSPNRKCQPSKSASCRESTAQLSRPNGPSRDSSKNPLPALSSVLSWSSSSISWALESGWSLPLSSSKPASPKPAGTVEPDTQNYTGMAHGEDQASCNPHIQPQLCSAPPPQSLWGCDQAPQQHRDIDRIKPKHKLKQSSTSSTRDGGEGEKGRGQSQN